MTTTNVAIIGAGAAGLSAGYELVWSDYNYKILEASPGIGGRLQKIEGFADFPIDIGGEWIHVHPSILDTLAYDNVTDQIDIIQYLSEYDEFDEGQWTARDLNATDYKFIDYTWFDFFNEYIAPYVEDNLHLGCQVTSIDWSSSQNKVTCADGRQWFADHVIITVPIKILQDNEIQFTPPLPVQTRNAIDAIMMMSGLKVFLKFTTRFYRDAFEFASDYEGVEIGQRYFYDATYGQSSDDNILGVFTVGDLAEPFVIMSDEDIVSSVLTQLDGVFDGQASANFVEAFVQNWNKEPFIGGAYSHVPDTTLWPISTLRDASAMDNRVFFAGEAIPVDWEWGFAHGAALSGRSAAVLCLELLEENNVAPVEEISGVPVITTVTPQPVLCDELENGNSSSAVEDGSDNSTTMDDTVDENEISPYQEEEAVTGQSSTNAIPNDDPSDSTVPKLPDCIDLLGGNDSAGYSRNVKSITLAAILATIMEFCIDFC